MKQEARKESMNEGSVEVDEGSGIPAVEESTEVEETSEETKTEEVEETQETETTDTTKEEETKKPVLTDKGTKLDENPQSAVHQQLANAKRQVQQMEKVLRSPELLRNYAKQNGMTLTEAKADIKDEKEEVKDEFTPDSFKTADDVAKGFNSMNKTIKGLVIENSRLREGQKGINSSRRLEHIANNMQKDITTVQEKYPELNPTSPEYNKELESSIGELYQQLDYNPATKSFNGKVSITTIANQIMKAAGLAKKQGSLKAQTDVKVKQAGKITSGKSKKTGSKESSDPGTSIAQKISKAMNS